MEKHNEEERPLIEGSDQAAEGSSGNVPGKTAKANHGGFIPIALKDYYKMRENFPDHFGSLLSVWTALLRKAGREKGKKTFTLSFGCVADEAKVCKNTARSCAKKLQSLHLLKVVSHRKSTNEYEHASWTLYPSYWPYNSKSKKPEGYATSEQGGYATDTTQPVDRLIDTEGFILHPSDIYENEENGIHSSGGRLEAAADDAVSSRKEKPKATDAAAIPPHMKKLRDAYLAERARGKGNHEG